MSVQLEVANVGLHVADVERSLAFYRDTLGFSVRVDTGWETDKRLLALTKNEDADAIRIVNLVAHSGSTSITLVELRGLERSPVRGSFEDPGTMHLALRVGALGALYERAVAAGYGALAEPAVIAGGPPGTAKMVFLVDPDGFMVELVEAVGD